MSTIEEPKKVDLDEKKDKKSSDSKEKKSLNDTPKKTKKQKDLPNFSSVEILDFEMTPIRNKELYRLEQILDAPIHNKPLLFLDKHEDALPLLSLYANKHKCGFLSISPVMFDMDYEDFKSAFDIEKKMGLVSGILEFGDLHQEIPIYCDLVDYMDRDVWGCFSNNFLKSPKPFIIMARKNEQPVLKEEIKMNLTISGCLENAEAPYIPKGLGQASVLEISPMTDDEKKVYVSHYMNRILYDNNLTCAAKEQGIFVHEAVKRCSGEFVLFEIFKLVDHLVVLAKQSNETSVSRKTIKQVFKEKLPIHNRTKALASLDSQLKKKIFGQDEAINKSYETILANLDDEKREKPVVLAFFGPSGVGKTALAEEISLAITGQKVTKIDMSEFSDSFKVSILTGSSKGYVDSNEDGLLAKVIKENENAVILLDEFEKAHPKVQQLFLGVFDKGTLRDNHAGLIDMSKSTIILTSNAGVRSEKTLGFDASTTPEYIADEQEIQNSFPPELLGRLDAKILFHPLNEKALEKIIDKYMLEINPRFEKLGVQVNLSKKAKSELIEKGKNSMYGARPILSLIRQKVKLPIEIAVLKKKIKKGNRIIIHSLEENGMRILPEISNRPQKSR